MHRRLVALAGDSRLGLSITILAGFLGGLLIIWQAYLLSSVISQVFLEARSLPGLLELLGLLLGIIGLRALTNWAGSLAASTVAVRIKNDVRRRLFEHLLRLGPTYTRGERTGELTSAALEGVEALDAYFSQYLPQLVVSALIPLSILVIVFPLDLLSGVILLLTAPLIPVFMILIGKTAEALNLRQFETLSRLSAHFLDSLQGLTTLKLFGRSKAHAKTIQEVNERFRDATLRVLRVTFLSALALELIATLSTAVVAVEVGLRLLYAHMTFQQALFLLVIAPEFYIPLRMLGLRYHAGMAGVTAARRIFEILDTPAPGARPAPALPLPAVAGGSSSIRFEDVSFTYPGAERPALQHIDLEIKPGWQVALVGASGAGKSTLAGLLLRFAEPGTGTIWLDGTDLAQTDADEWREQVAWVPQKPYLFHDTIRANICLGKPQASDDEVVAASQAAHLHTFIQSLPQGYNTLVGEAGARLSGGEAQRLALARAFLKNAPVLILDEPTSSLDPRQEALLVDSVRHLMRGRTVMTIAHRLNTVFQADRIIVLDKGQIAEAGTHAELLAKNALYARLLGAYANHKDGVAGMSRPPDDMAVEPAWTDSAPESQQLHTTRHRAPLPGPHPPTILRLLGFLRDAWHWVGTSVLLGAATIASSVALMGTSAYLISAAALHPSIAELGIAIVGVRFFGISRGVFRYLERLVSHHVTFHLLARLRTWFYSALEPLAPGRLMQYRSGDLLSRVVADVETLENFYVRVLSPPLVAVLIAAATALVLGRYDPMLGQVLLAFLLVVGVLLPLFAHITGRKPGAALVALRADLHTQLVDGIQGMADLVAFGRQREREDQIESAGSDYARLQRRMGQITSFNDSLVVLLTNFGMWAVLILAIPQVTGGTIPGVMLAALVLMTGASFEAVMPLALAAQMLGASLQAARRLFDVVDMPPVVRDQPPTDRAETEPARGELAFHHVSFAYDESAPVLDGINFQLKAGRSIAIVGPSGAGKSSLVNLLLRFWDYQQGQIMLEGRDLKSLTHEEVRRKFMVVSQNTYFFNTTLRQNLLLADPLASQAQIEAAAQQAHIHDFIAGLPDGYETPIGEQGLRLSGGERQRLAIARTLLKDAPFLLLDEPTANLDPLTEHSLLKTLYSIMKGRTSLMITHRLVGLEHFDEILVLDRGRVVEQGRHDDLLAHAGIYRQMWNIQNRILPANWSIEV